MNAGEFESVYREYAPALIGYARRCVGRFDVAEEIAGEAFLELYRNRERIRRGQLPAWLFTVVRNRAIDYWRRQRREAPLPSAAGELPDPAPAPMDEGLLNHPELNQAHRLCLTLRYVHGMSREEIAEVTGLREAQVKGYLRYALELLRKALAVRKDEDRP